MSEENVGYMVIFGFMVVVWVVIYIRRKLNNEEVRRKLNKEEVVEEHKRLVPKGKVVKVVNDQKKQSNQVVMDDGGEAHDDCDAEQSGKELTIDGDCATLREDIDVFSKFCATLKDAFSKFWDIKKLVVREDVSMIPPDFCSLCTCLEEIDFANSDESCLTAINCRAFNSCWHLRKVSLPRSVHYIGKFAFFDSGLESIDLNEGLVLIDQSAFMDCEQLKQLQCPKTLTFIGDCAFAGCSKLSDVRLSIGVRSIGDEAFACCPIAKLSIPPNVKYIGGNAFDPTCDSPLEVYFMGNKPKTGIEIYDEDKGNDTEKQGIGNMEEIKDHVKVWFKKGAKWEKHGIFGNMEEVKDRVKVWFKKGAKGWVDGEIWNGVVVHEKAE